MTISRRGALTAALAGAILGSRASHANEAPAVVIVDADAVLDFWFVELAPRDALAGSWF